MKDRKVKIGIFSLLLSMSIFLVSCGREETFEVSKGEPLVYLITEDAKASSFDTTADWAPKPDAMASVDRDMLTRWSPRLGLDNEWIYFDFGKPKIINKIIIKWERAYAVDYEILTSLDGKKWKSLMTVENQDGEIDELDFPARRTRFVKLIGLKRNNPEWGFSMWELEMYGPKSLNPDEKEENKENVEDLAKKKEEFENALVQKGSLPKPLTLTRFQKGIVYTSWSDTELASIMSDLTLVHLHSIGVRDVAIMIPTYQADVDSCEIVTHDKEGGDTPLDEAIIHAIRTCHSLGLRVMLKPHVDCLDGSHRLDIIPSEEWFANYKKMIVRYAEMAARNKVEMFCIGTELENTSFSNWDAKWRDVIKAVRDVYSGRLSYSANWTEYQSVSFWDEMDFIGIDAYFPLTRKNDPTEEELIAAWNRVADDIEKWINENNIIKGIIFTELGYVSSDGTNKQPWATLNKPEDQKEQRDALEAAFIVLTKRDWFKGLYIWQYFPQERWSPIGFTVRDKLAEDVLKKWYTTIKD